LTALAAVIGIGVLVAKLVDYQFSYISSRNIPDSQELASFFGFWFSTFNIVSLVIQLFITRHVLAKSGVSAGLAALPVGIVFCCIGLLFIPELWIVIVLKGLDGSLKQSLHKSAVELLALPIPSDVKNKTKTFIDVVVDSVATGLAGLILIFVVRAFDLSPVFITVLILVLVVAWVIMIMKVRDAYFGTFKDLIVSKEQIKVEKRSNSLIRNNMKVVFQSGGVKDILYMLDRVQELAHRSLKASIINLLDHKDPRVVAQAIFNLKFIDRGHPVGKVHDLIHAQSDEVVLAAMQYLMAQDTKFPAQFFENYLDHESDYISSAALLCLAQETEDNPKLADKYNLNLRINLFLDELDRNEGNFRKAEIIELVKAIGFAKGENRHKFIIRYLTHEDVELRAAAIIAAGNTAHENFLPLLIEELKDARFRESAITAIANYGNSIIVYLIKRYKDPVAPKSLKKYLPEILLELGTKKAIKALLSMSQEGSLKYRTRITTELSQFKKNHGNLDISQRVYFKIIRSECEQYRLLESCYYCQRIVERSNLHPERVIGINETGSRKKLIKKIEGAMEDNMKRIFNILALHFNSRDVFIAYRGLQSDKRETRTATMEFLEGLISRNFKTQLFPIIESAMSSQDANLSEINDRIQLPTEYQSYLKLLDVQDRSINKHVIYVIKDSQNEDLTPLLVRATTNSDPEVASTASAAYMKIRNIKNTA